MKYAQLIQRLRKNRQVIRAVLIEEARPPDAPGGDDRQVYILDPEGSRLILGRGINANIRVQDSNTSSKHAALDPPEGPEDTWSVTDLGSTNGTKVGGEHLPAETPRPLSGKLELVFGKGARFTFMDTAGLDVLVPPAAREKAKPKPKPASKPKSKAVPMNVRPPSPEDKTAPIRPTKKTAPPKERKTEPLKEKRPSGRAPAAKERRASGRSPAIAADSSIGALLKEARDRRASDLHLLSGSAPVMRVNGELKRRRAPVLDSGDLDAMIAEITTPEQLKTFEQTGDLDLCLELGRGRYRVNCCKHRAGAAISIRVVAARIPTLEMLKIPEAAAGLTDFAQGLVLITGPLGSGKTTTMLALVDLVNKGRQDHIITIEDPIECLIKPVKCQISQRELHTHTQSFGAALRGALREDPDIIMIGDLRDYDTAHLAIAAAETGHLVFASMATMNATKTIEKLIDLFPADEQAATRTMLSESLRGILCQHLLPGADGAQRVPAVELVFNSIAVANIIREGKTSNLKNAMQMGRAQGMRSLEASLEELVKGKRITREVADATLRG